MKTRMRKILLLLLFLTFVICNMEGCGTTNNNTAENPLNLVIVGATIRANQPIFNDSKIREEIMTACLTCGTVTLIAVDGEPYLVATVDIPNAKSGMSSSKYKQIAENQTNQIMMLMEQNKAVTDEADLLSALQLASRELNAHDGNKKLIIADSGISTKGYINLTSFEFLDINSVIQNLKTEQALPDLSSCEILWIGLADVAGGQPKLLQKDRNYLQELWTGILTESGAQLTIQTDNSVCREPDETLPNVHIVSVSQPVSVLAQKDINVQEIFKEEKAIVFDDQTLNFKPGTDELLSDERDVKSLLEPIAEYLKSDKSNSIVLLGTTASAGADSDLLLLSTSRCNTLKKLLISCGGVDSSQIEIYGLGYKKAHLYGLTIVDTDENGNFVEERGKQNRQVLITYSGSELAQKILNTENLCEGGKGQ